MCDVSHLDERHLSFFCYRDVFMRIIHIQIMLLLACCIAGCGASNQARIVPVEGKISFQDGNPLPAGTRLIFNPAEGNMGTATGITDESGTFKVVHHTGRNGAGVGKYTVQVVAPDGQGAEFYKKVSRTYFDNGGILTAEVAEGMGPITFTIKK